MMRKQLLAVGLNGICSAPGLQMGSYEGLCGTMEYEQGRVGGIA